MKTMIPTGMLMKKIQCHESRSVRIPPARTPMTPPPDSTKPKIPMAFARSAGSVKSIITSESATAATSAPPRPWIAREVTSMPCDVESPQRSDAR